jgi:phenylalanyl-tRNA synthetase beta subunit
MCLLSTRAIIGKSVKYDIQSEASHKFERGVDPDCQDTVLRRFIKLVSEHANIKDMSIISLNIKIVQFIKYQLMLKK